MLCAATSKVLQATSRSFGRPAAAVWTTRPAMCAALTRQGRHVSGDWLCFMEEVHVPILISETAAGMQAHSAAFKLDAALLPGNGRLTVLGLAREDFKTTAIIALACLRSNWDTVEQLLLHNRTPAERVVRRGMAFYYDVHLLPVAGGNWTDGGSAGVAIALTLLELFIDIRFRQDTAVTGALSLGGRVLPVERLSVGAKRGTAAAVGLDRLVVPDANRQAEEQAAGVPLVGVDTLWDAIHVCMEAQGAMLFPVAAPLPMPRSYSQVLTILGSQSLAVECSVMVPASGAQQACLGSGLRECGVATFDHVRALVVGYSDQLSGLLGDQAEFDLLSWERQGVPMEIVVDCPGNARIDINLVGPAMLLAVVSLFWGSVARLPEATAVSPGYLLTSQTVSHLRSEHEVVGAIREARPVLEHEGVRRWMQLPLGVGTGQGPATLCSHTLAAEWAEGEVVTCLRYDLIGFIAKAFQIPLH